MLNSEAHFLGCAGVTGFSDEYICQDMARDLCCVRSVVGEGEMSYLGFRRILVSDVMEVFIKPFMEGVFGLSHIINVGHGFCR